MSLRPQTGFAGAAPAVANPCGFDIHPYVFDTSSVVPLRSSSCQSPDLVLPRPFPSVLTTIAFDHSRRRWFGTCSCQPVPRGLPHRSSSYTHWALLGPLRSWRTIVCVPSELISLAPHF